MSPRHWVACSLFVVVVVGLFCLVAPESNGQNKVGDAGQGQPKWEYKVVGREGDKDMFNDLGEQGWELVAVAAETRHGSAGGSVPPTFYFKRRK